MDAVELIYTYPVFQFATTVETRRCKLIRNRLRYLVSEVGPSLHRVISTWIAVIEGGGRVAPGGSDIGLGFDGMHRVYASFRSIAQLWTAGDDHLTCRTTRDRVE